jgi:hypothetical protein
MTHINKQNIAPYLKIMFLCIIIFESNRLVSAALGVSSIASSWFYAFIMLVCTGVAFFHLLIEKKGRELNIFFYPVIVFTVFVFISLLSAGFIFIKPLKDWLPSLYQFTPFFIFYFLYIFKFTAKDVFYALVVVSISASLLLLIDQISPLEFLNSYIRRSAFFSLEGRRVVILKNEVIFGFVAIVSFIISSRKSLLSNKILLAAAAFLFLIQAFIMESRMGFLAMGVAVITLLYLKGITNKTMQLSIGALLVVFFVFPVIFSSHIDRLSNMSMNDSESNISIRFETVGHFYQIFKDSYGVGFGMMSSNSQSNNVLHLIEHYNIVDAGAFSSLFQFGFLGIIAWLFLTYTCLKTCRKYYLRSNKTDPCSAAVFAFLLAFTLSPLPISFFTSTWCISMGGIFLYLVWFYRLQILGDMTTNKVAQS